jgi:hypothetical protein
MSSWVLNTETDSRWRFSLPMIVPVTFPGCSALAAAAALLLERFFRSCCLSATKSARPAPAP